MRLTIRTSLALRTLMACAVHAPRSLRKQDIAAQCGASENHLGLVVHALGRAGFAATRRGRAGGLSLARPADTITVGQVMRAFEAPRPLTACRDKDAAPCPLAGACRLACVFDAALGAFYAHLDGITLSDLISGNDALARRLGLNAPDLTRTDAA